MTNSCSHLRQRHSDSRLDINRLSLAHLMNWYRECSPGHEGWARREARSCNPGQDCQKRRAVYRSTAVRQLVQEGQYGRLHISWLAHGLQCSTSLNMLANMMQAAHDVCPGIALCSDFCLPIQYRKPAQSKAGMHCSRHIQVLGLMRAIERS